MSDRFDYLRDSLQSQDDELGDVGPPPDSLSQSEARCWRKMALDMEGTLLASDRELLRSYSIVTAEIDDLTAMITKDGKIMRYVPRPNQKTGAPFVVNPAWRDRQRLMRDQHILLKALGATPQARQAYGGKGNDKQRDRDANRLGRNRFLKRNRHRLEDTPAHGPVQ